MPFITHYPQECEYTYPEIVEIVEAFVDTIVAENGLEMHRDKCVHLSMKVARNGCVNYTIECDGRQHVRIDLKYDIMPDDGGPIDFCMYQIYIDGEELLDVRNQRYSKH